MSEVAFDEFSERDRRAWSREASDTHQKRTSLQVSGQGQIRRNKVRIVGSIRNFKHQDTASRIGLKPSFFHLPLCRVS